MSFQETVLAKNMDCPGSCPRSSGPFDLWGGGSRDALPLGSYLLLGLFDHDLGRSIIQSYKSRR
jgi:hypothetical protein